MMTSEYDPALWNRRAYAVGVIFEDYARLQQTDLPPDTADERFGVMIYREINEFEVAVQAFHKRFSHYASSDNVNRPSFLHLVAPNAGESDTGYHYYDLGKFGLSHLTYRGVSERGTVILGEQLNIFDPSRAPYKPQASVRRVNCDRPGRMIGNLAPDISAPLPSRLLHDVHVHLQYIMEPTTTEDSPTLRAIPSGHGA